MHDLFLILGVPEAAEQDVIRRACRRRARRWHPELDGLPGPAAVWQPSQDEIAIDFVDMAGVTDRIHADFFDLRG